MPSFYFQCRSRNEEHETDDFMSLYANTCLHSIKNLFKGSTSGSKVHSHMCRMTFELKYLNFHASFSCELNSLMSLIIRDGNYTKAGTIKDCNERNAQKIAPVEIAFKYSTPG